MTFFLYNLSYLWTHSFLFWHSLLYLTQFSSLEFSGYTHSLPLLTFSWIYPLADTRIDSNIYVLPALNGGFISFCPSAVSGQIVLCGERSLPAITTLDICSCACSHTPSGSTLVQLIFAAASSKLCHAIFFHWWSTLSFCYLFLIALLANFRKHRSQKWTSGFWI